MTYFDPRFVLIQSLRLAAIVAAALLCFAVPTPAQSSAGSGRSMGQANGYAHSVPSGPATGGVLQLHLADAIHRALQYNLTAIDSSEDARIARGQRLVALSKLLPQISAGVSQNVGQTDLATLGLKVKGIPNVIGPYGYSSVDVSASQVLFSFESIQRFRVARTAERAAQLTWRDDLDLITLAIGNAYLEVIEANSHIKAQQAQVQNAKALYEQARDEVAAGTAPRIDLTNTEVQFHTEQYNLSVAQNNFSVAKLDLARAIGLPLGQQFELADQLPYSDLNPPSLDDAIATAYGSRSDLRAARDSERAAELALSATNAERYPQIAANGDYGDVGETFGHSHGDFTFQAGVSIPIFTGGRIKGEIVQARAQLQQRKAEADNLRGQIDYDVRTAFLNLNAAKEQVAVAKQNVDLANESLARSTDRYRSGVTNSVEVVQAEQQLASANDQYITALYGHNLGKLSLARALGVARTDFAHYLGGN